MAKAKPEPLLYFDHKKGGYWLRVDNRFLSLNTEQATLHLKFADKSKSRYVGNLNEVEKSLYVSQVERCVDYAGPLAGFGPGPVSLPTGESILVTSGPNADVFEVPTRKGKFEALEVFMNALFGSDQLPYVLGWLKTALTSLRRGDLAPGQMLVLAGCSGCGKSLFQALVTEFLGGRSAKPYRYMIGETQFNSDLVAAEHLQIEDENASTDIRSRRKFGASVKEWTVNSWISCHAKGRQAINLPCFKRLSLSCNDEPENLAILPPLDESLVDKIMLCRCSPAPLPSDDRIETWKTFTRELPRFVEWLHSWRIPNKLKDPRYGVKAYHHPDLMDSISALSPESRLLGLIDEVLWESGSAEWNGTADALEKELLGQKEYVRSVERLLNYSSACGVFLSRLANAHPKRFLPYKSNGKRLWTIRRNDD